LAVGFLAEKWVFGIVLYSSARFLSLGYKWCIDGGFTYFFCEKVGFLAKMAD